jgi:hypothetical protein
MRLFHVQFFEFWFVPAKKILGVAYMEWLIGCDGKDDRRSAGSGKMGQSVSQSIESVAYTLSRKSINRRHGSPSNRLALLPARFACQSSHSINAMAAQLSPAYCRNDIGLGY